MKIKTTILLPPLILIPVPASLLLIPTTTMYLFESIRESQDPSSNEGYEDIGKYLDMTIRSFIIHLSSVLWLSLKDLTVKGRSMSMRDAFFTAADYSLSTFH